MSRQLNTHDPLYPFLIGLFAIDDDNVTVREFVTNTAVTKETGVTVQNGYYGYDFATQSNGPYDGFGLDLSAMPSGGLIVDASAPDKPITIFIAFDSLNGTSGNANVFGGGGVPGYPNIRFSGTNNRQITGCIGIGTTDLQAPDQLAAATPASVAYAFEYGTSRNLYLDGINIASAVEPGYGSSGLVSKIGYFPGQGNIQGNIFLIAVFADNLSQSDVLRLHSSLTGSGNFALFDSGTAYTSDLSSGNFALTGNAITTSVARVSALDAGSFALTGNTINAPVARVSSLNAGNFTLTGNPLITDSEFFITANIRSKYNLSDVDRLKYVAKGTLK